MSFQENSQGSSSYAYSVLEEDPSFISFIVYQMIEEMSPAAMELNGERVLRNIPPFHLLNSQPLPLRVALDILDLWVWWGRHVNGLAPAEISKCVSDDRSLTFRYRYFHNAPGRTIYNLNGGASNDSGPYATPGATVFIDQLDPPPVSMAHNAQQARPTTRVRTSQRRGNREPMPLGLSSTSNAPHAAPDRRRRRRAARTSRRVRDDEDDEDKENQSPL